MRIREVLPLVVRRTPSPAPPASSVQALVGADDPPVDDGGAGEDGDTDGKPANLAAGLGVAVVQEADDHEPAANDGGHGPGGRHEPEPRRPPAGLDEPEGEHRERGDDRAGDGERERPRDRPLGRVLDGAEIEQLGDHPDPDESHADPTDDARHARPRNSRSTARNSRGRSPGTVWPAPSTSTRRACGWVSIMRLAVSTLRMSDSAPRTSRVGQRTDVQSGQRSTVSRQRPSRTASRSARSYFQAKPPPSSGFRPWRTRSRSRASA